MKTENIALEAIDSDALKTATGGAGGKPAPRAPSGSAPRLPSGEPINQYGVGAYTGQRPPEPVVVPREPIIGG